MSEIELYGYGESVASNMARVALSEKNISYKYNLLYLESKGEHLSQDYKKLNPKTLSLQWLIREILSLIVLK